MYNARKKFVQRNVVDAHVQADRPASESLAVILKVQIIHKILPGF
jgi:hypothetical protein